MLWKYSGADSTGSRRAARRSHSFRRLRVESLEPRQLLSATSITFKPDHIIGPHFGSTVSGYTPAQIRAAYGFNKVSFGSTPADGRGQTIAIVDAFDDPNIVADLAKFDATFGIAAPPSFRIVNQTGGTALPGIDPLLGWEGETVLDVEWAHAIAPGAKILLVESASDSADDLFAAVNYARNQPGVSVISLSWGADDDPANAADDLIRSNTDLVTPAGHAGITFVAATGDMGLTGFPATSPNVLAVGGTNLYLTSSGSITKETAWTLDSSGGSGGGGASVEFPGRQTPDVAYNAGVGVAVYDTFGFGDGWEPVLGTSAGTPQWAALLAIANQGRALAGLGPLNGATETLPALYAAPAADFRDITAGSTEFQTAKVGYDLATGLGSPKANLLIPYLATLVAPAAPADFSVTAVSPSRINLDWTGSAGTSGYRVYEQIGGQAKLIATIGPTETSYAVTGLSPNTTYTFQVAAYNFMGSTATAWGHATTMSPPVRVSVVPSVQLLATSNTSVQVSWTASAAAVGYRVYEFIGGHAVQVASVSSNITSVNVDGQTPGTTEYFYVTAYNGTSSVSTLWYKIAMPTVAVPTIAAATNLVATATSTTTGKLSWSPSVGALGYRIYYWNGVSLILLNAVGSATTTISIAGLRPGATTSFAVAAYNSTSSAASNLVGLTTPA